MVAGNENLDLGACHVRSGPDPTSGSAAPIRSRATRAPPNLGGADHGPSTQRCSAGGPIEGPATEQVEVEVVHGVQRIRPHVEHQAVACLLYTSDAADE